jgi:metal-dependent amidase/aminoacylase/carboxypeptidase family protein
MWGEDFSYYGRFIPAYFWFIGVRPKDLSSMPALHNSKLNPEEDAMKFGIEMLVLSAINFLNDN